MRGNQSFSFFRFCCLEAITDARAELKVASSVTLDRDGAEAVLSCRRIKTCNTVDGSIAVTNDRVARFKARDDVARRVKFQNTADIRCEVGQAATAKIKILKSNYGRTTARKNLFSALAEANKARSGFAVNTEL